jgi:hypothetical protein
VAEALGRLCALVERNASGWSVGGLAAGDGVDPLAEALYARWYTQPGAPPALVEGDPPPRPGSLLLALRAAHADAATISDGWTVLGSDPRGIVSVANGEDARLARPGEYLSSLRPGVPPAPGEPVALIARRDHLDAVTGLWWTFGEPPLPPIGRVYLDTRPTTLALAVHEATAALAPFPYQLKCPVLMEASERVDAVVIYHRRADRDAVLQALLDRPALSRLLDPAVPPLTCPVRPGLAWADDVEQQRSFGESRCHTLAGAIRAAATTWASAPRDQRLALLVAALRDAGVDVQRPWKAAK